MKFNYIKQKGFTLVELVISIGIFAFMTALLIAKFGTFNQGVLLSNLAYDIALTIRNAQSYGLNVKSAIRDDSKFDYPYGVHFVSNEAKFTFFADSNSSSNNNIPDGIYTTNDNILSTITTIKRGSKISALCIGTQSSCTNASSLDITFKRPDPNAIIKGIRSSDNNAFSGSYAKITVTATDGSLKNIEVRSTGQIQVTN